MQRHTVHASDYDGYVGKDVLAASASPRGHKRLEVEFHVKTATMFFVTGGERFESLERAIAYYNELPG